MAGLAKIQAYAVQPEQAITKKFIQHVVLDIEVAAGTDLDLSDNGGTFWTAVADADALALFNAVATKAGEAPISIGGSLLSGLAQVTGAPAAGQYAVDAINANKPDITLQAAAAGKVHITYELPDNAAPVEETVTP